MRIQLPLTEETNTKEYLFLKMLILYSSKDAFAPHILPFVSNLSIDQVAASFQ